MGLLLEFYREDLGVGVRVEKGEEDTSIASVEQDTNSFITPSLPTTGAFP